MARGRGRGAGPRRESGPWIAVAGTRPNYVKLGPLVRAAKTRGRRLDWIDTAQHSAQSMAGDFAAAFEVGSPVARLAGRRAVPGRIAWMADALETKMAALKPSLVIVLGDVDSTLAGALAAWRLDLPLAHVEAGLRSFESGMPEERNRVIVDALSDRLYASEPQGVANLRREGVAQARIRSPGNVMADALQEFWPPSRRSLRPGGRLPEAPYVVVTLHRQSNVDDPQRLAGYVRALGRIAAEASVVFPLHPRTRRRLRDAGLIDALRDAGIRTPAPLPYGKFLRLVSGAAVAVTDSGGLQVEAALLGTRCVTARARTEHLLTLDGGGNVLAGSSPRRLAPAVRTALEQGRVQARRPRAWDGHAAERIVEDLCRGFSRPPRLGAPPDRLLRGL